MNYLQLSIKLSIVHVEILFSKSYGLCGKIFQNEKLQHKCGILPQKNS